MTTVICSGCNARFDGDKFGESVDFDQHECLTGDQIRTVKRACDFMGLAWRSEVARPVSARRLCGLIDRLGMGDGCEAWGRGNRESDLVESLEGMVDMFERHIDGREGPDDAADRWDNARDAIAQHRTE